MVTRLIANILRLVIEVYLDGGCLVFLLVQLCSPHNPEVFDGGALVLSQDRGNSFTSLPTRNPPLVLLKNSVKEDRVCSFQPNGREYFNNKYL